MEELTFDEATHTYKLGDREIPSVTTITSILSNLVYGGIDKDILRMAADKGTAVHKAIEEYELFGEYELEPKWQGYMEQYLKAKEEIGFKVIKTEQRLHNFDYAGTIDCIGKYNEKTIIIDWKTTSKLHEKLIQPQLSAYCELADVDGVLIEGLYVLHLTKTKYEFKEIKYDMTIFNKCLDIYNYIKEDLCEMPTQDDTTN